MRNLSQKVTHKLGHVKLVATDLDGTLLDDHGEISEATRSSVRRLEELGMRVAIMTGRAHSSAERIAHTLGVKSPIISLDGGLVRLPHSGGNIFASYIKPGVVRKVIDSAEQVLASVALFVDDRLIRLESSVMIPGYIESLDTETEIVDDLLPFADRTIRVIIGSDSKDAIRAINRSTAGLFSPVAASFYRSSQHDDRWYLEVRNRDCSKATGLVHLEKYFRINKKEVAVLGDFRNDIEAFKRAGTCIAMKNAVWELKEKADLVTESTNDGDGAAEFFELLYNIRNNNRHRYE